LVQTVAIYCRVSTSDQSCERQDHELTAYASKAGWQVTGVWKETGSGAKDNRLAPKVLNLIEHGNSYRSIAAQLRISKTTVSDIVKRYRSTAKDFDLLEDIM
jgi:DNA invertase Pin-like site-specific DNA recombinase